MNTMSQDKGFIIDITLNKSLEYYASNKPLNQCLLKLTLHQTTFIIKPKLDDHGNCSSNSGILYNVHQAPPKEASYITFELGDDLSLAKLRSTLRFSLGLDVEKERMVMDDLLRLLMFDYVNTNYHRINYNSNAGVGIEWPQFLQILPAINLFMVQHVGNDPGSSRTSSVCAQHGLIKRKRIDECSICLQDLDENTPQTSLCCDHVFHENCIVKWLSKSLNCPLCRERVHVEL